MDPILDLNPENILLVQLGDIGDVVLTAPSIRAAKETYPNARISILVFRPYSTLLAADPHIYEVLETKRIRGSVLRLIADSVVFAWHLRQKRYDLVIDLRTGDRGAIVTYLTGAQVRIGYRGEHTRLWHKLAFSALLDKLNIAPLPVHPGADQSLRILRQIGIKTSTSAPKLYISREDSLRASALLADAGLNGGTGFVTINPFSRWKYKEWDNGKWGKVIDSIWDTHRLPAILIGAPEEAATCQEIVVGREGRVTNLAGKTTLGELAAVISSSSLHLGVDSAAPHIASALGTPTVTIHGPSDWRAWRIVNKRNRVVTREMNCLPCNMKGCDGGGKSKCLDELTPDPVVCVAIELLNISRS